MMRGRSPDTIESEVEQLCARVRAEAGRLDVLVNDIWGGDALTEWGRSFWALSIAQGQQMLERAVHSHLITSRHGARLMIERDAGLIVEVTDGDTLGYRGNLFYDLAKHAVIRLAYAMAADLHAHHVTALAITPGFLRSEAVLDTCGTTEANWRDAIETDPYFAESETLCLVGRAVAALAADPNVGAKSGGLFSTCTTAVFGLFARPGQVSTESVSDGFAAHTPEHPSRRGGPHPGIIAEGWHGDHGLVDLGDGHVRVNHARDACTTGPVPFNGIDSC